MQRVQKPLRHPLLSDSRGRTRCGVSRAAASDEARHGSKQKNAQQYDASSIEAHAQSPSSGSVLGAFALITGTTVGAGIIALPQSTISAGFAPTSSLLLGLWAVLSLEGLLLAEVNLRCHAEKQAAGEDANKIIPLAEMASMTVGPVGSVAVTSIYLCLAFTLLLAYVARGGDILSGQLHDVLHISSSYGQVAFAGLLGSIILAGGTPAAEKLNSGLTAILLTLFVVLVSGGAMQADWSTGLSHADWTHTAECMPIMFLALMYHDLIPVLCQLLGFDRRKVRTSLIAGSIVPLAMYLSWEAVCFALVPYQGTNTIDPMDVLIASQGSIGGALITAFCLTAISTSFIGTSLSLIGFTGNLVSTCKEFVVDRMSGAESNSADSPRTLQETQNDESLSWQRTLAVLLALAPPTYFSMGNPELFATATHYAGGYGMTLLYGALPPILAWQSRAQQQSASTRRVPKMVGGGRLVLASLLAVGILAETLQLPGDVNVSLPNPVFELAAANDAMLQVIQNVMDF